MLQCSSRWLVRRRLAARPTRSTHCASARRRICSFPTTPFASSPLGRRSGWVNSDTPGASAPTVSVWLLPPACVGRERPPWSASRPGESASRGNGDLAGRVQSVTATAWIRGRVLVVVSASSATKVYAVDPDRRLTISQIDFPGTVVLGARAQSSLVLLLASPDRIGLAPHCRRSIASSADSRAREIVVGTTTTGDGAERRMTIRRPALTSVLRTTRLRHRRGRTPSGDRPAHSRSPLRACPSDRSRQQAGRRFDGQPRHCPTDASSSAQTSTERPPPKTPPASGSSTPRTGRAECSARNGLGSASPAGHLRPRRNRRRLTDHPTIRHIRELFRTGSVARVTVVGPRAFVTFFGTNIKAAVVELGTGRVVNTRPRLPTGRHRTTDHRLKGGSLLPLILGREDARPGSFLSPCLSVAEASSASGRDRAVAV